MRSAVKKWGNSPSIRIPAPVMAELGLRLDQPVDVRVEQGRLVIEPLPEGDDGVLSAVSGTLGEWTSDEDEAAFADL
jgi:antitoxin MazE